MSNVTTVRPRHVSQAESDRRATDHYQAELDSHADTCCIGNQSFIVQETGQTISVSPFVSSLGAVDDVPIVTAALAYDDPYQYHTCILFFHQALYFKDMQRHLIGIDQLRHNQIIVNDTPLIRLQPEERNELSHSIIHHESGLHIPLELDGTTSYFVTRKPTLLEIQDPDSTTHVHMASEGWDPFDPSNKENEAALRSNIMNERIYSSRQMMAVQTSASVDVDSHASVLQHRITRCCATSSKHRKGAVDADTLAKRWNIGREEARRTLERTTQRAVRDFTHTKGGRRLKPYACQLKYPRLNTEMYADTLIGKMVSLRGNKYAQVYCTPFGWCMVMPMKQKSDAHYTLDELFQRVGFPKVIIPDNALEKTQGQFRRKCLKAQVPIHPIEAYMCGSFLQKIQGWKEKILDDM